MTVVGVKPYSIMGRQLIVEGKTTLGVSLNHYLENVARTYIQQRLKILKNTQQ